MVQSATEMFNLKSFRNVTYCHYKILMLSLKKGYISFLHRIRETVVKLLAQFICFFFFPYWTFDTYYFH